MPATSFMTSSKLSASERPHLQILSCGELGFPHVNLGGDKIQSIAAPFGGDSFFLIFNKELQNIISQYLCV